MDAALVWDRISHLFRQDTMHVLLLTEDANDHALFLNSITSQNACHRFTGCTSIAEVWAKLTLRQFSPPSLIFIDFELSRSYDHELVQILKRNEDLGTAPVIVFADSAEQEEILATYRLQVACFVVFPKDRELRQHKIQACIDFWANYAELPELRRWWGQA